MSETIIDVSGLSYKVGKKYILRDINWEIKKGENWILFGLNGSGKTTLLSIISGYHGYIQGNISMYGREYSTFSTRKEIAFVSSSFFDKIYSTESVLDIVLSGKFGMFGVQYDIDDVDLHKARRLLKEFNVGEFIDSTYNVLSKGERQNVLLARAMMNDASIIILDEPCSGLDVYARKSLLNKIEEWAKNPDLTVIYVTHHIEEIIPVFENTLLMKNAKVYKKGITEELFATAVFDEFISG